MVFILTALLVAIVPAVGAALAEAPPVPAQPLRAWTVAGDTGEVFVLDAASSVHRLAAGDLAPLARSPTLFPAGGTGGAAHLAADGTRVFAGSESATQTVVLDTGDLSPVAVWDRAGPMAVDPGQRLFMISDSAVWAYDLNDLSRPPVEVLPPPEGVLRSLPRDLEVDPASRRLIVRFYDAFGSPPHNRDRYGTYDLDTFAEGESFNRQLGSLSRPAVARRAGLIVSATAAKNGFLGSNLAVFDRSLQELRRHTPIDGLPAVDPDGEWIYLLRPRGLWVLDAKDLSLQAIMPFAGAPPAGLALSPGGETLYLFGDGWLESLRASEARAAGVGPVSPFPRTWTHVDQEEFWQPRFFPSPEMYRDGTAFVQVGYGETYRTTDGGHSWEFLPGWTYPRFRYPQGLSLSPDFAADRTLVAPAGLKLTWRSIDAADTWEEWTPRIAFTSDRGGSRDIYTMDQDGSDVRRLTGDPSAEEAPAWSPAWTRIAYQSDRNGNWDIFTKKSDCDPAQAEGAYPCAVRQLTDGLGDDMLTAWSPDGRSIAFVSTRDGNPEIYVMDKDGGNQRRLTFNPTGDWRPAWMPDSRHLVFTSDRGGSNDIYALEVPPPDAPAPSSEIGLTPVVTGPADDRDPAVNGQSALLFLSDRDGVMRSYQKDLRYPESGVYPVAETIRPEGHPAWIEDSAGGSILVSVEGGGATNIYRASYPSTYTPLTRSPGFNGHPTWGPGWWQPDAATSLAQLEQYE